MGRLCSLRYRSGEAFHWDPAAAIGIHGLQRPPCNFSQGSTGRVSLYPSTGRSSFFGNPGGARLVGSVALLFLSVP